MGRPRKKKQVDEDIVPERTIEEQEELDALAEREEEGDEDLDEELDFETHNFGRRNEFYDEDELND